MSDQDLRELLAKATPVRDGWNLRVKDDGEERYELIGDPCGFPVATFGDASDAEFDLAARQHLPDLLARLAAQDRVIAEMGEVLERFVAHARVGTGNKPVTRSARVNCPAGIYHDAVAALAGRDGRE